MRVLVDGTGIAAGQIFDGERECLFVVFHHLLLPRFEGAADAGGQDIVDGALLVVLLKIDRTHGQTARSGGGSTGIKPLLIAAPFTAHKVERGKAQHRGTVEAGHEHAHEADGREVTDVAHLLLIFAQGDAEEIPFGLHFVAVARLGVGGAHIDDVVLAHHHFGRVDAHAVLIVLLVLVERVVLIDVLDIGRSLVGRGVTFGAVFGSHGVAVRVVDILVAVEDGRLSAVPIRAAIVVVLVGRRTLQQRVVDFRAHHALHLREELGISAKGALVLRGQSVEPHILTAATAGTRVEGISHRVLCGHTSPGGRGVLGGIVVEGETAFVELLAVFEHVLRDFTEVEVEVARERRLLTIAFGEGVHHPKLHILNVGGLKVRRFEFAHHAAPAAGGIGEASVAVETGVEVIRAAFVGIEGQVEHGEGGSLPIVDALVGVEVRHVDFPHPRVGKLAEVVFDVAGGERRTAAREEWVDVVPSKEGAVVAIAHVVAQARLRKESRRGRNAPLLRLRHVDHRL